MRSPRRGRAWRLLRAVLLVSILAPSAVPPPADAQSLASPERTARMRARQGQLIGQGMQAKAARRAKRVRELKQFGVSPSTVLGLRARREGSLEPEPARVQMMREAARLARDAMPMGATSVATNVRVNNPASDPAGSGQAEVSVAADGSNILVAWNDGAGFGTPEGSQGYGWSNDGGATWTDGGTPPNGGGVGTWSSDPVVIVNETTHTFYYCGLSDPSITSNTISIVRATFTGPGTSLVWQTPVVAVQANPNFDALDKQWAAVDPASGNVYISYTSFSPSARIKFVRSTDGGGSWSTPVQLSAPFYDGYVQGSRVVVGPLPVIGTAPVYVAWYTVGIDQPNGEDYLHVAKSTTQASTWGATQVGELIFSNWGSGAPGFNRGLGFTFPSLAVDRSTSATKGRVYLSWHESVNFYLNNLGTNPTTLVEPNNNDDTPATAHAFTMGQNIRGTVQTNTDLDYYRFTGTAGQTVICYADTITGTLDASFRLFCTDGVTRLSFSRTGSGSGAQGLLVATLPASGDYYLRMASALGSNTGGYSIHTGLYTTQSDRSRDNRDIFVKWSADGLDWTAPTTTRVNQEPAGFDGWLPEVVVAPNGNVYVAWFDWRDSPALECGGRSNLYIARSTDGLNWTGGSPVSSVQSDWTDVASDIAPNQGDYNGLYANGTRIHAAWSDGRDLNPDVYFAAVDLAYTSVQVSLVAARATPDRVELEWHAGADVQGTVYRRTDDTDWAALGPIVADGTGRLEYVDSNVAPGARYGYRLGIHETSGETFAGEAWVDVPLTASLRLAIAGARPNPTSGPLRVAFTLPTDAPARIEVLDVSGRRVRERAVVAAAGNQVVDLTDGPALDAGVYLFRLTQSGRIASSRVVIVR